MIETSILINFYFSKICKESNVNPISSKPSILDFFYQLKLNLKLKHKRTIVLNDDYKILRPNPNRLYECKNRTSLVQNVAVVLETNIRNNIVLHMYPRVKKYFKIRFPAIAKEKNTISKILEILFTSKKNVQYDNYLNVFRQELNLDNDFSFVKLESKWWLYIHFLYKL